MDRCTNARVNERFSPTRGDMGTRDCDMTNGCNQSPGQLTEPRHSGWRGSSGGASDSRPVASWGDTARKLPTSSLVQEGKHSRRALHAIVIVVVDEAAVDHNPNMIPVTPTETRGRSYRRRVRPELRCCSVRPRTGRFRPLTTMKVSGGEISRDPIGENGKL